MNNVAIRNIVRASTTDIDRLGAFGVATTHEAMGRSGLMQPYLRPIYPGAEAAGSAITVLAHPGDNWMLHVAIELCRAGDLLVVGCSAECTDGMFGELLATSLIARGVRGLVIDAGCRDVSALRKLAFPVWSKAISAKGTVKATVGAVNAPIVCAGALVHAGDVIVADDDGVVIVPREVVPGVVADCESRMAKEAINRKRLAAGELGLDIYDMRAKLAAAGLKYQDSE